jgi:hypothetical protein
MPKDDATPSAASRGSHAELIGRLAETIGADGPSLTQSIRIDVNVHKEPTVTVTRLADADQIGMIIQCSTWADYTLVENDELKRLRKGAALTAEERRAVASAGSPNTHMAAARLSAANTWLQEEIKRLRLTDEEREAVEWYAAFPDGIHADTLRSLLERLA